MPDIWTLAAIAAKFSLYAGVLTAAGSVFAALMFRISGTKLFAGFFAIFGLAGAVIGFSLGGAALTGEVSGMVDPEMLGLLWSTPAGTALSYRLIGLTMLLVGLICGGVGIWVSSVGGLIALWSFATVGHIPDQGAFWINVVLMLHLIGVALWIGILTPLRRLATAGFTHQASDLGHRFGQAAALFVPFLVVAGVVMGYYLVGSFDALFVTGYGQVLIVKIMLVGVLLALAALNKLRFVPRLTDGDTQASRHLSRSISFEWVAVISILFVTAVLTSTLNLPS